MSGLNCSTCGHPLTVDALTNELRPCSQCGSVVDPSSAPPVPDAEHERRISKEKRFEIGIVVTVIVVGMVYLMTSRGTPGFSGDGSATLTELSGVVEDQGYIFTEKSSIYGRRFMNYEKPAGVFKRSVDLVTNGSSESVETVVMALSLQAGKSFPSDAVAERAIQDAIEAMADLGKEMLPSSAEALAKAAATMVSVGGGGRAHNKGVAGSSSGWKVTYIVYREYDEGGEDIPMLLVIYQLLEAASGPELETFNRALYRAINEGGELKSMMRAYESSAPRP